MKKGVIYKIVNKVNNKLYIGKASDKSKRLSAHKIALRKNQHPNQYLQRSWNKYGETNFSFEIIEECLLENLLEREYFWIHFFNSINEEFGYNLEIPNPIGKGTHSLETIEKLKKAWVKRKNTECYQKQLEQIRQVGLSQKGKIPANNKLAIELSKKAIFKKDLNNNIIEEYACAADAARDILREDKYKSLSAIKSCISETCNGKQKTAYGFKWEFKQNIHKQPEQVGNAVDI